MIHLPEVEVLKRELERDAVGRVSVKSVEVLSQGVIMPPDETFEQRLVDAKVKAVDRSELKLLVSFDNEEILSIFLGSGGQLRRQPNREKLHPKTKVVLQFAKYGQLRLLDFKRGARMRLVTPKQASSTKAGRLDPLRSHMSWRDFANWVRAAKPAVLKDFLSSGKYVIGLGQLYSDEVLFEAGLRYDRVTHSLNPQECRRLWRAIVEVLNEAVKYRGTTLEKDYFYSLEGVPGQYQEHLNVFRKQGELSPRSRRPLVRVKHRNRWTYYCEQSQV